jgi:hypothetical protein
MVNLSVQAGYVLGWALAKRLRTLPLPEKHGVLPGRAVGPEAILGIACAKHATTFVQISHVVSTLGLNSPQNQLHKHYAVF